MDAIKNLLTRNASSKLTLPMPSSEQMQIIYQPLFAHPIMLGYDHQAL